MNYKEIVQYVLENGKEKTPERVLEGGRKLTKTLSCFNLQFRHDMSQGFPLSTLRKMPFKSIKVELEGFIKGITSKSWYEERGCYFWSKWANPITVKKLYQEQLREEPLAFELERYYKEKIAEEEDDLGTIYGYQWRNFNKTYPGQSEDDGDFFNYSDQLKIIVDTLKSNPADRRMVCSAWNPNQMHMMALPPCHFAWMITVIDNKLNLAWFQRSCDVGLGLPSNIASYALLLELLSRESGIEPGELCGTLVDCHIYENHIDSLRELITRNEYPYPTLIHDNYGSIFDWEYKNTILSDYYYHDKLDIGKVEV